MPTAQRQAVYGLIRGLVGQANIIAIPRLFLHIAQARERLARLSAAPA